MAEDVTKNIIAKSAVINTDTTILDTDKLLEEMVVLPGQKTDEEITIDDIYYKLDEIQNIIIDENKHDKNDDKKDNNAYTIKNDKNRIFNEYSFLGSVETLYKAFTYKKNNTNEESNKTPLINKEKIFTGFTNTNTDNNANGAKLFNTSSVYKDINSISNNINSIRNGIEKVFNNISTKDINTISSTPIINQQLSPIIDTDSIDTISKSFNNDTTMDKFDVKMEDTKQSEMYIRSKSMQFILTTTAVGRSTNWLNEQLKPILKKISDKRSYRSGGNMIMPGTGSTGNTFSSFAKGMLGIAMTAAIGAGLMYAGDKMSDRDRKENLQNQTVTAKDVYGANVTKEQEKRYNDNTELYGDVGSKANAEKQAGKGFTSGATKWGGAGLLTGLAIAGIGLATGGIGLLPALGLAAATTGTSAILGGSLTSADRYKGGLKGAQGMAQEEIEKQNQSNQQTVNYDNTQQNDTNQTGLLDNEFKKNIVNNFKENNNYLLKLSTTLTNIYKILKKKYGSENGEPPQYDEDNNTNSIDDIGFFGKIKNWVGDKWKGFTNWWDNFNPGIFGGKPSNFSGKPGATLIPDENSLKENQTYKLADGREYIVTSPYAKWRNKSDGSTYQHTGSDIITTDPSNEVKSPISGTIVRNKSFGEGTGWNGYGNVVSIQLDNGNTLTAAHLDKVLVENGQKVSPGDVIGIMGNTGHSDGAHIHWELRKDDSINQKLDPSDLLLNGDNSKYAQKIEQQTSTQTTDISKTKNNIAESQALANNNAQMRTDNLSETTANEIKKLNDTMVQFQGTLENQKEQGNSNNNTVNNFTNPFIAGEGNNNNYFIPDKRSSITGYFWGQSPYFFNNERQ